jgi:SAM-dependent methyltransferase
MISRLINKIFRFKLFSKLFIKPILKLHGACYKLASNMAIQLNDGIHPKHKIMKYKEWFLHNINDAAVVLDIGCNTGMMPKVMSAKAKFVYGIEIEKKHIEIARIQSQQKNIEFICADALSYDYSKCMPIDVITLSNVLEHIDDRVNFLKTLIKKIRWKDTKVLLIRVPMIDRDWITVYKKEIGLDFKLDRTHFVEYTFVSFQDELNRSEIEIVSYEIKFGEIYAICKAHS